MLTNGSHLWRDLAPGGKNLQADALSHFCKLHKSEWTIAI